MTKARNMENKIHKKNKLVVSTYLQDISQMGSFPPRIEQKIIETTTHRDQKKKRQNLTTRTESSKPKKLLNKIS